VNILVRRLLRLSQAITTPLAVRKRDALDIGIFSPSPFSPLSKSFFKIDGKKEASLSNRLGLIQSMIVDCLLNLSSFEHSKMHDELREIGGIPLLLKMLSSSLPTVQTNAAAILRNICVTNSENQTLVGDSDGLQMLIELLHYNKLKDISSSKEKLMRVVSFLSLSRSIGKFPKPPSYHPSGDSPKITLQTLKE